MAYILMYDLDSTAMKSFYKNFVADAEEATKVSGIADFLPEAQIDAVLFDPCSYSVNGITEDSYFTVHVTPQLEFSYASFETNIKAHALCQSNNEIFEEGYFSDAKRTDWQFIRMKNYGLSFGSYIYSSSSTVDVKQKMKTSSKFVSLHAVI